MKKIYLLLIGLCLIIQLKAQVSKTINITAGTLSSAFTSEENSTITSLTITGTIDDRDIETIQYGFPLLTELDLSGTTLVSTHINGFISNPNWWPGPTLTRNQGDYGGLHKPSLTSIKLPSTLEVIGYRGFEGCSGLTSIIIPPTVKEIGEAAFGGCSSLASVTMPPSVINIGDRAFSGCNGLTELPLPSNMTSIGRLVFGNCTGFIILKIPQGIKYIGLESFIACTSITTLTLPESVEEVDHNAFALCPNISAIYSYNPDPPYCDEVAFEENVQSISTLYVPFGSKALYDAARGWNEFNNIVEMAEFRLEASAVTLEAEENATATVKLHSAIAWQASSDQGWLTVSHTSGSGGQLLTFTAQGNPEDTTRIATVTISAEGTGPLTIVVSQKGIATGVAEMTQKRPLMTCYPNPFAENITIEIQNSQKEKITVDIYNLQGQRVKNLTYGNRAEKITLNWDGSNEKGQKVVPEVYICQINEQSKHLMYKGK